MHRIINTLHDVRYLILSCVTLAWMDDLLNIICDIAKVNPLLYILFSSLLHMAAFVWLQTHIASNQRLSFILCCLFPWIIILICLIMAAWLQWDSYGYRDINTTLQSSIPIIARALIPPSFLALMTFFYYKSLIFWWTGTQEVTTWPDYDRLIKLLEPLCISRGLPIPNLWIIESPWSNAFALWREPVSSRIVVTRWLLDHLDDRELEWVLAHELVHIIQRDGMTMLITICWIGAIMGLSHFLIRAGRFIKSDNNQGNRLIWLLFSAWLIGQILGSLFFPLIKMAVSRKREYIADAWAVELTKDAHALASALKKIAPDAMVDELDDDDMIANLCIASPFGTKTWLSKRWHNLWASHPPIEERIDILERM